MALHDYKELLQRYGFKVTDYEEDSIIAENMYHIGAFSMRNDGMVTGAFFDLSEKNDLLSFHADNMKDIQGIKIGWSFYFYDRDSDSWMKERVYDLKILEWYLNRYIMCGDAVYFE